MSRCTSTQTAPPRSPTFTGWYVNSTGVPTSTGGKSRAMSSG
jgi:hypothetical protein